MNTADTRKHNEAQALACLEAAARYKPQLLALAVCLSGNEQAGMDLYQQSALDCHDAIQSGGFVGERFEFYLRRAIKNLYYKNNRSRTVAVDFQALGDVDEDEGLPREFQYMCGVSLQDQNQPSTNTTEPDGLSQLAEEMMSEAKATFTFADRIVLRMHTDGESTRQIAAAVGLPNHLSVWRSLERMKGYLRDTFQQAWDSLGD